MTARTPLTLHTYDRFVGLDLSTVTPDVADVTNGNSVPNSGHMFLDIHNTNSGSTAHIVSFSLSGGVDGQPITPKPISIAATKTIRLGPWPSDIYGGLLKLNGAHVELTFAACTA